MKITTVQVTKAVTVHLRILLLKGNLLLKLLCNFTLRHVNITWGGGIWCLKILPSLFPVTVVKHVPRLPLQASNNTNATYPSPDTMAVLTELSPKKFQGIITTSQKCCSFKIPVWTTTAEASQRLHKTREFTL